MTASVRRRVKSRAVSALFGRAIDYAGLYPPASLSMADAVAEYQRQRFGADAWALGRFVVGAAQLDAFAAAREQADAVYWPLSVLSSGNVTDDVRLISAADAHSGKLRVEAIEAKVTAPPDVQQLAPLTRLLQQVYVEVPCTADSGLRHELIAAVRSLGPAARAKIRTGGVTPDAIPSARHIAEFMRACAVLGVPIKATAGLHHLIRGDYALTYEPGSLHGMMFGFLNVFAAAALAQQDTPVDTLVAVLEERDVTAFEFGIDELSWRGTRLTSEALLHARRVGLQSFGSCSFQEPVAEMAAAGFGAAE